MNGGCTDGVAHIAGTIDEEMQPTRCVYSVRRQQNMPLHDRIIPYLERAGLYHLVRLNAHWFWLDEPLTHTFHMPFGECTISSRMWHTNSGCMVLPADASEETVRIYARAYIMMLQSTQLFMDKSANRVHLRWLPFMARLYDMGSYSWGIAALAWLYRCMCRVANRNVTNLAGPLQLLQSWIFWRFSTLRPQCFDAFSFPLASRTMDYSVSSGIGSTNTSIIVWEPYGSLDILAVIHSKILIEEHIRLWRAVTSLIYFAVIKWHQVDRVFPQLGSVQHMPEPALNIEYLHSKDDMDGDRWFSTYYRTWHQHWDERVCSVLSVQRVADPSPSAEYLDWWHRVAHRILSPGIAFADPRPTQVLDDAILRGSSQAPTRVPISDIPDNRRVEQR
ncbi:uncharacterized protein DS421_13g430700 [Arachis hypogaea]|nr:uncharacterized protein DS421_13g430700 [Arachis hypogaea]